MKLWSAVDHIWTTRYQRGVLVVVLISILWEEVYEGSVDAQAMGVDEGNSMIMSSAWFCLLIKIIRLVMKPSLISRYHPKIKCGVEV
jgi:hypothetical protein